MKARQSVRHLPVERLAAHPSNVRDDLGDLTELARSIVEHGILQPLTVTEHTLSADPSGESYLLLAGHRRLAAARQAGLTSVPCIIRHDVDDQAEQLMVMLVENCQRTDLNPIEKAEAFQALRGHGLSPADIARRAGLSTNTVAYHLRLLDLSEREREQIRSGALAATRALTEAAAERQHERLQQAQRPVGRPKGRTTTPHFSTAHPLADHARCTHRGVPKVGGVACGPCWERAIRDDALGVEPSAQPDELAELHDRQQEYDEAAVLRALDGDRTVRLRKPDRIEVVHRARARGWSYSEIIDRTSIAKPERYIDSLDADAVAS